MKSDRSVTGPTEPLLILADAARTLREHYLQARAAVAEAEGSAAELRARVSGASESERAGLEVSLRAREADLAELRLGMRSLRDRYEELEHERLEAESLLSAAQLRLRVQELLRQASPGHEAEALEDARRAIALTTAQAEVGGDSLDPETRLELEKIDRLARALRLAEKKS